MMAHTGGAILASTLIHSINPATEELLASYEPHSQAEIASRLHAAQAAAFSWKTMPILQRADLMKGVAGFLRQNKAKYAGIMTSEMGKPIVESEAEVEKCALNCDYYADNAEQFLADEPRTSGATESYIQYTPLGVILAVMPWNYPFWQVFRFAAPALMAGNSALLKHASNVPQCALAIEEIFREAGFPRGIFQTLLVGSAEVPKLIEHPVISAVTLTGSEGAGKEVAGCAGRMLKKTVLELGGSDPFIVLEDADFNAAVLTGVRARFQNTGQSCIAAKRFIVVDSVFQKYQDSYVEAVRTLKMVRWHEVNSLQILSGRSKDLSGKAPPSSQAVTAAPGRDTFLNQRS
jgi:acyl-CoA reductase-like NAD-dependent aldehyde dehydrogenase